MPSYGDVLLAVPTLIKLDRHYLFAFTCFRHQLSLLPNMYAYKITVRPKKRMRLKPNQSKLGIN